MIFDSSLNSSDNAINSSDLLAAIVIEENNMQQSWKSKPKSFVE